ncbi:MAG: hypothetical protein WDO19_03235 [Bacteroidota bacterium]
MQRNYVSNKINNGQRSIFKDFAGRDSKEMVRGGHEPRAQPTSLK